MYKSGRVRNKKEEKRLSMNYYPNSKKPSPRERLLNSYTENQQLGKANL